jgi:hypothetical protein
MINKNENYAAWALLMYELEDAQKHLETLMQDMTEDAEFDETDFRIQLGHIYSHLNRARNGRNNESSESTLEQHEQWSQFPKDLGVMLRR